MWVGRSVMRNSELVCRATTIPRERSSLSRSVRVEEESVGVEIGRRVCREGVERWLQLNNERIEERRVVASALGLVLCPSVARQACRLRHRPITHRHAQLLPSLVTMKNETESRPERENELNAEIISMNIKSQWLGEEASVAVKTTASL